jgi:hypothetical protein
MGDLLVKRGVAGDVGGGRQAVLGDAGLERGLEGGEANRVDRLEAGGALAVEGGAALGGAGEIDKDRDPPGLEPVEMRQPLDWRQRVRSASSSRSAAASCAGTSARRPG